MSKKYILSETSYVLGHGLENTARLTDRKWDYAERVGELLDELSVDEEERKELYERGYVSDTLFCLGVRGTRYENDHYRIELIGLD